MGCNGKKDKPTMLKFRWVGNTGSSVTFASSSMCVGQTTLTSNSNSNEVVLDSEACFGSRQKLPTNIYFTVDGKSESLHASCSQALNVGDVVYKHPSKGSLIVAGFTALSGRTDSACAKPSQTCAPRSFTPPSFSCDVK